MTSRYAAEPCAPAFEPLATPQAKPGPMPHQIVVRLDGDLLDALRTDAEDNGRTLAQTVRHLLRRALEVGA